MKDVIGGWQIGGLTKYQVGLPLQVTQTRNNLGRYTETQRPDRRFDPALSSGERTIARWFKTEAFVTAPALRPGNSPRFPVRAPGFANWDLALMRNIPIRERLKLQFRGEFFSAWNHANFNPPNTQIGNANFGRITSAADPRNIELVLRIFF